MKSQIKVSIISISYNQEKYIEEALNGFVNQKTDFKIEVILGDDCSTDQTAKIINNFAKKYPDIIKPILRKKNIGIANNLYDSMRQASGEYLALCEGDDYWTDPKKLQTQADFLDNNPEYSMCFHPVEVFFENGEEEPSLYPKRTAKKHNFTTKELLKGNFIQTNSVLYKKQNYDNLPDDIMPLDWFLHLYHAQFGKIGYIDRPMSVYRRHTGGVWWGSQSNPKIFWANHGLSYLNLQHHLLNMYGNNEEYRAIILMHFGNVLTELSAISDKRILELALTKYLDDTSELLISTFRRLNSQEKSVLQKDKDIATLQIANGLLEKEIYNIKKSLIWKLESKARTSRNLFKHIRKDKKYDK